MPEKTNLQFYAFDRRKKKDKNKNEKKQKLKQISCFIDKVKSRDQIAKISSVNVIKQKCASVMST